MTIEVGPYSTAAPFFGALDSWLPADDAQRMAAYALYESMYDNDPQAYKLIQRGSEANPIYIPSAKTIIEACNRFLCKGWTYVIDPSQGEEAARLEVDALLDSLFRREEMWSKFATQKRFGLIRGDAVWHVFADPAKEEGKRISIIELDPAMYFPIEEEGRVVGCHLVDVIPVAPGSTEVSIRRQTYRKVDGKISYEVTWWESGAWDDREGSGHTLKKAKKIPVGQKAEPAVFLPDAITAIPVYHVKNSRMPMAPYGASELKGLERLGAALSQTITDEDLALVLAGLGVYVTTSGSPVDDDGNEVQWQIGPGSVAEIDPDSTFNRIDGVKSITPNLEHARYIEEKMRESSGTPDIAIGTVDVAVAESGIALQFKMSPILAKNAEKEQEILSVMDHMLYDLTHMWFPAYEGLDRPEVMAVSVVDDPLPTDRKALLEEVLSLLGANLVSIQWAQLHVAEKLGFTFPENMLQQIVEEKRQLAEANSRDMFQARVDEELA